MMAARFYTQLQGNLDTGSGHNRGPYALDPNATHGASAEVARAFGGNLIWNGGNAVVASGLRTAQHVVNMWMASPGHRAYLLSPEHMFIGVGAHVGVPGGIWAAYYYMFLSANPSD